MPFLPCKALWGCGKRMPGPFCLQWPGAPMCHTSPPFLLGWLWCGLLDTKYMRMRAQLSPTSRSRMWHLSVSTERTTWWICTYKMLFKKTHSIAKMNWPQNPSLQILIDTEYSEMITNEIRNIQIISVWLNARPSIGPLHLAHHSCCFFQWPQFKEWCTHRKLPYTQSDHWSI